MRTLPHGAALSLLLLTQAQAQPLPPQTCALTPAAARLEARKLLDHAKSASDPAAATTAVELAYRLSPAPLLLYALGALHAQLHHPTEAADLLRRYQAEAGPDLSPPEQAQLRKTLTALPTDNTGELTLSGESRAFVYADGRLLGKLPLPLPVLLQAGPHRIRAEKGYRQAETAIEVPAAARTAATLTLPPVAVLLPDPAQRAPATLLQAAAAAATAAGLTVISTADAQAMADSTPTLRGRLDQLFCRRQLGQMMDAPYLLSVAAETSGAADHRGRSAWRVAVQVIDVAGGEVRAQAQAPCPLCTPAQAQQALEPIVRSTVAVALAKAPQQQAAQAGPGRCAMSPGQARLLARVVLDHARSAQDPAGLRAGIELAYRISPAPVLLCKLGALLLPERPTEAADLLRRCQDQTGEAPPELGRALAAAQQGPLGELALASAPLALVYVDDRLAGRAPLGTPLLLPVGTHRLRVEQGYRQQEQDVAVEAGRKDMELKLPQAVALALEGVDRALPARLAARVAAAVSAAGAVPIREQEAAAMLRGRADLRRCGAAAACQRELGVLLDAQSVLALRAVQAGTAWQLGARVVDVATGAITAAAATCPMCDEQRGGELLGQVAALALAAGRDQRRGALKVRATPDGEALVDGWPLGRTPCEGLLAIGPHEVLVERPGHARGTAQVKIAEGQQAAVSLRLLELTRGPALAADRAMRPRWRVALGASALAAGAGLAALGAWGLSVSGQCHDAICTQVYDTVGVGAGLLAAGAVGAAGGAVLLALPAKRQVRLTVGGQQQGAGLLAAGTF